MISIPGGQFSMGSDRFYPEERPAHTAMGTGFQIAQRPVTNLEFREFASQTGYVTVAERELTGPAYAALSDADRAPGSLVFHETPGPVDLRDWRQWWAWVPGASWRAPLGPDSDLTGKDQHPVTQVCFADATAYAEWAGGRLPTEAEWEHAARGGTDTEFAWGDELHPAGEVLANTWLGRFPYENRGWGGTSPVGTFAPNGYGLFDMIGNVWEWTTTVSTPNHRAAASDAPAATAAATAAASSAASSAGAGATTCCGCSPQAPDAVAHPAAPNPAVSRVTKGGSHLCSPDYCQRYRPAARSAQTEDSATSHLGFRIAK
ncbi:formylglycine-generating enzyme family protein [Leucobacter sp. HY1910]